MDRRVEAAVARRLVEAAEAAKARTKAAGEESLRRQAEEGANQKSMAGGILHVQGQQPNKVKGKFKTGCRSSHRFS